MKTNIELKYKTDKSFKWFVDDAVKSMLSNAIYNQDTWDTWESFWYKDMPYDVNIWTDEETSKINTTIYSCYFNKDNNIYLNESDFYRVREDNIDVHRPNTNRHTSC